MAFPDASFDKVVAMYVVSVVPRPAKLLEELHRVCRPDGEIFIVNHFQSENPIMGRPERALAGFHRRSASTPTWTCASSCPLRKTATSRE